jgi:hypothetical protein
MRESSGFARSRPLRPSITNVSGSLMRCFAVVSLGELGDTCHWG